RSFARSGTEKNNLAVARNQTMSIFDLLRRKTNRPGNRLRLGTKVDRIPQIDYYDFFTLTDLSIQLLGCNTGDSQTANKAPALNIFPCDIDREPGNGDRKH